MAKATKTVPRATKSLRGRSVAYVLKVTLREVRPPIWRRVRVAGDLTLRELHHVLQIALGWTDSHLHEFEIGGKRYGMPDPQEDFGEAPLDDRRRARSARAESTESGVPRRRARRAARRLWWRPRLRRPARGSR